jgi:hypothetical protein
VQRKLGKERAVVLGVIFNDNNEAQIRAWARDADRTDCASDAERAGPVNGAHRVN